MDVDDGDYGMHGYIGATSGRLGRS